MWAWHLPGTAQGSAPAKAAERGAHCPLGETGCLETVGSLLKETSGFVIRLQGNGGGAHSRCDPALPGLPLAPDLLVSYVLDTQERKGPAAWLSSLSPSMQSAGVEGGRTVSRRSSRPCLPALTV